MSYCQSLIIASPGSPSAENPDWVGPSKGRQLLLNGFVDIKTDFQRTMIITKKQGITTSVRIAYEQKKGHVWNGSYSNIL